MQTDGQLYREDGPPPRLEQTEQKLCEKKEKFNSEELVLLCLILLLSGSKQDLPLILALAYVLLMP